MPKTFEICYKEYQRTRNFNFNLKNFMVERSIWDNETTSIIAVQPSHKLSLIGRTLSTGNAAQKKQK